MAVGLLCISRIGEVSIEACPLLQPLGKDRVGYRNTVLAGAGVRLFMIAHLTCPCLLPQRDFLWDVFVTLSPAITIAVAASTEALAFYELLRCGFSLGMA